MAKFYEIVIYTASLSKYASPLLERLDRSKVSAYHLFREHCIFYNGVFVKDLSRPRTKGHSFHQTTSHRIQIGFPKSVDSKQQPQDQRLQSLVTQVSKDDAPRSVPRFAVPMIPRSNQAVLGPQS